jgi:hypothetical protein
MRKEQRAAARAAGHLCCSRRSPARVRTDGGRPLSGTIHLSDERTEFLIRDRLSFMRFLGLGLADTVPDANTIWTFREALTRARLSGKPAIEVLFERFNAALSAAGYHRV